MANLKRQDLGRIGEKIAANFLKRQGYSIRDRNFKFGHGEIDIVAFDKNYLCFIEVKTQKENDLSHPLYSITKSKQHQLSKLALFYIKKFHFQNKNARFDVVTVIFKLDGSSQIDIIKNAFDLDPKYV